MTDLPPLPPGYQSLPQLPDGYQLVPMTAEPGSAGALLNEQQNIRKGVVRGLMDVPEQGAELLTRGLSMLPGSAGKYMEGEHQRVEDINAANEKAYEKEVGGHPQLDFGRLLGNAIVGTPIALAMPGAAAEGLTARLLSGAASGGAQGFLQPTDPNSEESYWNQRLHGAEFGAAGGAGGTLAAAIPARIISGATNPNIATLRSAGVTPSTGQLVGSWFNDLEQKATSIPGLGNAISAARQRAYDDLNRAAINRSLGHINESLDPKTALGRDAVTEMGDKISTAYNRVLSDPNLIWQADPQFMQSAARIGVGANLAPAQFDQFKNLIQQQFAKVPANGAIAGETYKEIESKFGKEAAQYMGSGDVDQRKLGQAYKDFQNLMRVQLRKNNPQHADMLSAIDAAYADAQRVEVAAAMQGAKEGVFSPGQLSSAVKSQDKTLRDKAFARGQARMQDLSDAGKSVLGPTVPDSGTAGRLTLTNLALGAGTLPLVPAYSAPAQRALATILASRPQVAQPVASLVRSTSPVTTSGLAALLANQGPQSP